MTATATATATDTVTVTPGITASATPALTATTPPTRTAAVEIMPTASATRTPLPAGALPAVTLPTSLPPATLPPASPAPATAAVFAGPATTTPDVALIVATVLAFTGWLVAVALYFRIPRIITVSSAPAAAPARSFYDSLDTRLTTAEQAAVPLPAMPPPAPGATQPSESVIVQSPPPEVLETRFDASGYHLPTPAQPEAAGPPARPRAGCTRRHRRGSLPSRPPAQSWAVRPIVKFTCRKMATCCPTMPAWKFWPAGPCAW
ncbi:MAG: hypothetical protein MUE40_15715 [Anaerolineae bacterium]|nr:hypothetical protein [Anaerolineae bacterium]